MLVFAGFAGVDGCAILVDGLAVRAAGFLGVAGFGGALDAVVGMLEVLLLYLSFAVGHAKTPGVLVARGSRRRHNVLVRDVGLFVGVGDLLQRFPTETIVTRAGDVTEGHDPD